MRIWLDLVRTKDSSMFIEITGVLRNKDVISVKDIRDNKYSILTFDSSTECKQVYAKLLGYLKQEMRSTTRDFTYLKIDAINKTMNGTPFFDKEKELEK